MENKKPNIMVIDDTHSNLELLEDMLSEQGYEVRPLPRPKMALKAALLDPPDLILLDIMMPEMDGYELCSLMKEDEKLKEIPIIFMSALTDSIDKVKAFSSGGIDYVTKPFQFEDVHARVKTHLRLRQYQKDIENKNLALKTTLDELKDAQAKLVQSEKMASLGVLTAGIAHEINNPINFINASSRALKMKLGRIVGLLEKIDAEQDLLKINEIIKEFKEDTDISSLINAINDLTGNISTGAERSVQIVKGLRTFSRLDQAEKKKADIHENIESTLILLHSQYQNSISIKKEYGKIPEIVCYPGKLNQVFLNILKNSIDAIKSQNNPGQNKTITIKTFVYSRDEKEFAAVEISDTGPGIPQQILNRIFDPFFTSKDVGKGTGLGLSISLGIIESHGGTIEVKSEKDKGACFTMYIPFDQPSK